MGKNMETIPIASGPPASANSRARLATAHLA